jgi:HEAT repeat protein
MHKLPAFLWHLPWWQLAAGAALVVLAATAAWRLLARLAFGRALRRLAADPEADAPAFRRRYPARAVLARSAAVARQAQRTGAAVVAAAGIDDLWLDRFVLRRGRKDLERILRWVAPKGLFRCFVQVMERPRLAPVLFEWLRDPDGDLDVHKLALAGRGEPFDGAAARLTFRDHLEDIRHMTGDPEWPSRYFAVRVLVHDQDERSARALWQALRDGHPLVRRTAIEGFAAADRERLYEALYGLLLDDPVYEVRRAAWERIHRELPELYHLNPDALADVQAYHVLELLRPDSKYDENVALRFLAGDNLEQRLAAARFLERTLTLERLAQEVDLGDRVGLERSYDLLRKATEVGVTSFVAIVERTSKLATLLVCARLLAEHGNANLIANVGRKVWTVYKGAADHDEIYRAAVQAVSRRGPAAALNDLNRELLKRRADTVPLALILANLPARGANVFEDALVGFLKDPDFPLMGELRQAIRRVLGDAILPVVFDILHSERQTYPHAVRIQALELLAEMGLPYCLQAVLENLTILPAERTVPLAAVLARFPQADVRRKVDALLQGHDARLRASLIAILPATGEHEYVRVMRPCLKDADPDVRVAAVWALVEMGDIRSLNQSLDMLRDPVERVRAAAARAIAAAGSEESLRRLRETLCDSNEADAVRAAAIAGLGALASEAAVDMLMDRLKDEGSLQHEIVSALAAQTAPRALARVVEAFKDADPALRDLMTRAFRGMGERGEKALVDLLAEEIPSLRPLIADILEATGHVEERIRDLTHRDPAVRRDSADFLVKVGSRAAFRGIVLAARDPDQDVRVRVVKAIERLETESGKTILEALQADPERRVRNYTAWALERLRAKAL